MNKYISYVSIENNDGDNLRLIPFENYNENKHYLEQEYSAQVIGGDVAKAKAEINNLFKADRKEWVKNAFGYLD